MKNRFYRRAALALLGCLFLMHAVGALHSQSTAETSSQDGRVSPGKEWPLFGGDWTNQRYSTLNQIDAGTVKTLGGAWQSKKFGDGASSRSTPVVKDGLMFVNAGTQVYALNAKTGETAWNWRSDAPQNSLNVAQTQGLIQALNAGRLGIPSPPGVAVGEDKVFVGLMDGRVAALSQKTGEMLWIHQAGEDPPKKGQSISGAPTYANGVVYAGLANGDWGLRGRMVALDASTGKELWHFFTVPAPGEPGHDTWAKDNDVWKRGGGGVWHTPVLDPDLGMVYFQTGNAQPGAGGEVRPGDNLYVASAVALDMKTGKLKWYYQVVHHDLWDADIAVPLVLYDAQVNGRPRKALAAMRPDGVLFLLDRETGKPIIPVEERPVPQDAFDKTSPTQPYPVGAESMLPDCSTYKDRVPAAFDLECSFAPPSLTKLNVVATGVGVRVAPMSYSPQTGYFYEQGSAQLGPRRRVSKDPWFGGGGGGGFALLGIRPTGILAAIDSRTDKVVWKKEWPVTLGAGGSITTAGGLLFQTAPDGNFQAYDAKSGDLLWQFQTGAPGSRGQASTYELDGNQYVALVAGTSVWAFKLGGTLPQQPAPAMPQAGGGAGGAVQNTDEIETSSLAQSNVLTAGHRWATDEYSFNPTSARVKVGARVTWINNGTMTHTIVGQDGSWTTGSLNAGQEGYVTFDKPGTYMYYCKDHPWALGQIIVVAADDTSGGR